MLKPPSGPNLICCDFRENMPAGCEFVCKSIPSLESLSLALAVQSTGGTGARAEWPAKSVALAAPWRIRGVGYECDFGGGAECEFQTGSENFGGAKCDFERNVSL